MAVCDQPPGAYCDGQTAVSWSSQGTCVAVDGLAACQYSAATADCAAQGWTCHDGVCLDVPPRPGPGEALLTELMRAPADTWVAARQWFEVRSLVDDERSLAGCVVVGPGGGAAEVVEGAGLGLVFEGGELLLLVADGAGGDGLPAPDGFFDEALDLGAAEGEVRLECDGAVVDAVDLGSVDGATTFPTTPGASAQLDPGWMDPDDNDAPGVWCSGYLPYGAGGLGTPGSHNLACDTDIDWCRTWYPAFMAIPAGGAFEVQAHVFEAGLTDQTSGAPDLIEGFYAQVGFGPDGSSPEVEPEAWGWSDAVPDEEPPGFVPPKDDRWIGAVAIDEVGAWDFAARFTADGGLTWKYCDLDGSSNGYSPAKAGHVSVN